MPTKRCTACGSFVGEGHTVVNGLIYCHLCDELLPPEDEEPVTACRHGNDADLCLVCERDRLRAEVQSGHQRIERLREYLSIFCSCEDEDEQVNRAPGEKCGACKALAIDAHRAQNDIDEVGRLGAVVADFVAIFGGSEVADPTEKEVAAIARINKAHPAARLKWSGSGKFQKNQENPPKA